MSSNLSSLIQPKLSFIVGRYGSRIQNLNAYGQQSRTNAPDYGGYKTTPSPNQGIA